MRNAPLRHACLALLVALAPLPGLAQERVRGAHENLPPTATTDDLGITIPIPNSYPARRYPAEHDFPTGPAIGEHIPDFALPNQDGRRVDFHRDRAGGKAILVFFRSAVW